MFVTSYIDIFLVKSLSGDWALSSILSAYCVVDATVWVDPDEFVAELLVAEFANALISNNEIRLLEIVGFLLFV